MLSRLVFGWLVVNALGLWACLAASLRHFRSRLPAGGPPPPMTLIKPVKGLDEGLRANFESVVSSDPHARLQVLIAVESPEDPAYPVLCAFRDAHPDRDIELVLSGPSGPRMGKIHNMMAAYPKAKHPIVIFSDADIRTTPELVAETGERFDAGADACYALPYQDPEPGLGGVFFQIAFNHSFSLPAALFYAALGMPFCAGAWMAYRRDVLDDVGGLGRFDRAIADDFAISWAVLRSGARGELLRTAVRVREECTGALDAFWHLVKWARIIRWTLPPAYFLVPLFLPSTLSLAWWALGGGSAALAFFAVCSLSRALVGLIQDLRLGSMMPWWAYPALAFADVGTVVIWLCGLPRRISWRGKRYRLAWGGRVEVISP